MEAQAAKREGLAQNVFYGFLSELFSHKITVSEIERNGL